MSKTNTNETTRSNGYPFMTQAQVVTRLATDHEFRITCLMVLCGRQTLDELDEKATKWTNKRGLRCSEAVWMPELAAKLNNNLANVTAEELGRLADVLPRYRKQLAAHFRSEHLRSNPDLQGQAALFGIS